MNRGCTNNNNYGLSLAGWKRETICFAQYKIYFHYHEEQLVTIFIKVIPKVGIKFGIKICCDI